MILGIDEAGRGPWAGPLVVGAVVLGGVEIEGLTDSKKLTKKRREMLELEIIEKTIGYGLGWVSAKELDEIGMSAALKLATIRAVSKVKCSYDEIIIDGTVNFLSETGKGKFVKTMPKADLLIPSVSAASILAKVARDKYMEKIAEQYPEYSFAAHVGYGTAKHRAMIEEHGVTPEHRLSFAPLQKYQAKHSGIVNEPALLTATRAGVTTKQIGDRAETVVAEYLENSGHEIVARNWKTRFCEIDIISFKDETIYFTEVKYRKKADWGDGMSAITAKKQKQMRYAAEVFGSHFKQFKQYNQRLAAASVAGGALTLQEWMLLE